MTINRTIQIPSLGSVCMSIELTAAELRETFEECRQDYRLEDIRNHLDDMDESDLCGYTAEEVAGDPILMECVFQRFTKCQDCELPENDVMKESIRTVLADQACRKEKTHYV